MSGEISIYTASDGIIQSIPPPRYDSLEVTPRRPRRASYSPGERESRVKTLLRLSAEITHLSYSDDEVDSST